MKNFLFSSVLIVLLISSSIFAQDGKAQPEHVSQLFSMACVFNKTLSAKSEVSVYIYKDDGVTTAMKSFEGQKVGSVILKEVASGSDLPASQPDILFIGDKDKSEALITYCNENAVLCLTSEPDIVKEGASLGVTLKGGKAMLLLNPKGVAAQKQSFNPAIMKIAKVSK